MAFMQSPGVEVKEYDLTGIVPGVASTEAGIGGLFHWGPVEKPELISTETELVARFGKPSDTNYETFYCAANFLAYSDALFVSRAVEANSYNATANTGAVANTQIKNDDDFSIKKSTLSSNAIFFARYPGALGNSLKVAVCDSAEAYNSTIFSVANLVVEYTRDTFEATVTVTDPGGNTAVANTAANSVVNSINVGDYLKVSDPDVGSQYVQVSSIGSLVTANTGVVTFDIALANRFSLSSDVEMDRIERFWEYSNVVERAPGTSISTETAGGAGDELHIVVIDEDGKFTGIPGQVLEVWNNVSRATDTKAEQGGPLFYKDVINGSSRFVYAASDIPGATTGLAGSMTPLTTEPQSYSFTAGTDSPSESLISLNALARAYDKFANPDEIDISILISGKSAHGIHGEAISNYIVDNIVERRRDCVVTISPALTDVVNNPYQEEEDLIEFRSALRKSSYSVLTTAYKYQYDRYNDKWRWIPGCGDDAGLISRTDKDRDAWWSPAGHSRGVYKNLVRLAYNPDTQAARDLLYKNDINPVITVRGSGTILYGDKTLLGKASAFDRINVRRLLIVLQKAIKVAARELLFEFNDPITRARFRNMVNPYLRDIQGRRGLTDFKVVCDETNNTGQVIDSNRFVADIYLKPARSINFITLNFVVVGTDVDFNVVIGQF